MQTLYRGDHLAHKVLFVDGLPGCGKTLFSKIVSTMSHVELLSYLTDVENICALFELEKIPIDAAKVMIQISTDLKIYQTMMGRDVNFRVSDLSSAVSHHDTSRYLKRIFGPGGEEVLNMINLEKPILNIASHNLLPYSEPIWSALGDRCVFLNVVRHPLYIVRQQVLNVKKVIGTARHFSIYYNYEGQNLPYFVNGWESDYITSNHMERTIHFLDKVTKRTNNTIDKIKKHSNILTVPFEKFVLNPDQWMNKIADIIGSDVTDVTRMVMKEQNIPRDMVAQGIDLDMYRRCGWVPPRDKATERDELNVRRDDVAREVSSEVLIMLDQLSKEYEDKYWSPDA
jgi:hypothetical protein